MFQVRRGELSSGCLLDQRGHGGVDRRRHKRKQAKVALSCGDHDDGLAVVVVVMMMVMIALVVLKKGSW